ncbi:RNA polymerase factor sigma-54 [Vagococcus acidifermentans]|uniref:RNA polymerase factor sigma-54 n=1 Tax=Vagococcus acidifermentans TaxID=564710 RepID=A0A430AS39_9ENTE|nr:RNA polymerase factor sigma-54 [Vagococcus acidifermentans]RSU10867.1 RNA polymerase factor sigma-54 [Vagococcus acidifermentans]
MRFEQTMSQKQTQTQKLAMTQQLQQSIQMLQYNTDELLTFLEAKSLENPLIDVKIDIDQYDMPIRQSKHTGMEDGERDYLSQIPDTSGSLFEYLIEQIHLNYRDTKLRQLMLFLVEFIDVNGYLTISLEEAADKTQASYIEMVDALTLLQQLDPAGVGARNLQECLMLQTERDNEAPSLAYLILEENFENLANRHWQVIEKMYRISLSDIQKIFDYIQRLSPNPGAVFHSDRELYVIPDLIVEVDKESESLKVLSTKRSRPRLIFQKAYYDELKQVPDKEVQKYMKEKKADFDWIKRGLQQRGDTILNVGQEIVSRQKDFFLKPDHPLKPLMLKEVAERLGIHESTVSRSVNGKYLQTSFGVFELRSFFTTALSQANDEETSAANIKHDIVKMVENENKAKPLSDQKIAQMLADKGVEISRRTVAKYRDQLGIPASSKRKRYD